MKQIFAKVLSVGAACLMFSVISFAQDETRKVSAESPYLISAKAGGVNFVAGKVAVVSKKGKSGYLLKGDILEAGDKVLTGTSGKSEILLNPGSFVRLNGNSEFEFLTTDLDDLRVSVNTGSAIFEVITANEFKVTVQTPKSVIYIVKSGIYRVDAMPDGTAKIEVWKGKAQIAGKSPAVLKGGQTTSIDNGQVAIEKFDRDEKDEFELWSKERAKELDKLNAKLQRRQMNQALTASFSQNGWNSYSSLGVWVRDPLSRSYCFLPFGFGWYSPYGFGYDRSIWNYQLPANVVQSLYQGGNSTNNQSTPNPPYMNVNPGNGFPGQGSANTHQNIDPVRPVDRMPSIVDRKVDVAPRVTDAKDQ